MYAISVMPKKLYQGALVLAVPEVTIVVTGQSFKLSYGLEEMSSHLAVMDCVKVIVFEFNLSSYWYLIFAHNIMETNSLSGDCDTDEDCIGSLQCLQRSSSNPVPVPGCTGEDNSGNDYCYGNNPPTVSPTITPTSAPTTSEPTSGPSKQPTSLVSILHDYSFLRYPHYSVTIAHRSFYYLLKAHIKPKQEADCKS